MGYREALAEWLATPGPIASPLWLVLTLFLARCLTVTLRSRFRVNRLIAIPLSLYLSVFAGPLVGMFFFALFIIEVGRTNSRAMRHLSRQQESEAKRPRKLDNLARPKPPPIPHPGPQDANRVAPGNFDGVKEIADRFLCGQVVLIDIVDLEHDLALRTLDFSMGICYGTGGQLERIDEGLYLLIPPDNPPLPAAAALPVQEPFFTDAVSAEKVG